VARRQPGEVPFHALAAEIVEDDDVFTAAHDRAGEVGADEADAAKICSGFVWRTSFATTNVGGRRAASRPVPAS
jgi:hypothetical protein